MFRPFGPNDSLSKCSQTAPYKWKTLRGCDFIAWDRLPACQKYGENDRLEAYPTIFSQPLPVQLLIDSGADVTLLPKVSIDKLGIQIDRDRGRIKWVRTNQMGQTSLF
jgi:hypothetical protein